MNWTIWTRKPGGEWVEHASYARYDDACNAWHRLDMSGIACKALMPGREHPSGFYAKQDDDNAEGGGG